MRSEIIFFSEQSDIETRLTFCVHRPVAWPENTANKNRLYNNATSFEPARPRSLPGKGFPALIVNDRGDIFRFTSSPEISEFCRVFNLSVLPTADQLAEHYQHHFRNRMWISRVPKRNFKRRLKLVEYIDKSRSEFDRLVEGLT